MDKDNCAECLENDEISIEELNEVAKVYALQYQGKVSQEKLDDWFDLYNGFRDEMKVENNG